jgi:NAD(P)-dependent dehydrogenase (short-subunit alcohol dehydrogenase family)
LITGASRGIGRATALAAAERGFAVAVHYRSDEAAASSVVAQLRALGSHAIAVRADLSEPAQVEELYRQVDRELGALDAVVNNAGVALRSQHVTDVRADSLQALFAVNVFAVMLSCAEAVKRLAASRGGRGGVIVNVSSMAATIGGRPGNAHYAASKAAVDTFTIGLAKEVSSEGIRVLSVRPGMVETDMVRERLANPEFAATVRASIPLGRAATEQEIAKPIAWLLSDEAAFITGTCVEISGGGFHIARGTTG